MDAEPSSWLAGLLDVNPEMQIVSPRGVEFSIDDMLRAGLDLDDLTDHLDTVEALG